jgi:outer membrane protein TolC
MQKQPLVAAHRQFALQEKRFKAIGELFNAGQVSEVDLHKEEAKIEEVELALESAQQNREKVMLQLELDRSSELEKSQLNSKKLQQQREAIDKEIPELQKALREVARIGNSRLAIEACEDRIRSLDRKINELMIQETELEVLVEFLSSRLTPAEGN